jgi:hypothetical protein
VKGAFAQRITAPDGKLTGGPEYPHAAGKQAAAGMGPWRARRESKFKPFNFLTFLDTTKTLPAPQTSATLMDNLWHGFISGPRNQFLIGG